MNQFAEKVKEMVVEQHYDQICQRILRPGLRNIAMTYSVPSSILYDNLLDLDYPDSRIDFDHNQERDRVYRRLRRIMNKLILPNATEIKEDSDFRTMPKVFDDGMYAAMKSSYERIVDLIEDRTWFSMLPSRYMDVLEIDGRTKMTFVETAAISSIYMALRGPAVDKLNHPLSTFNEIKRGKQRVKKIIDALHSKDLYQALVRTVFDLLAVVWEDEHAQAQDVYYRQYWIKSDKQDLKYLDYALKHHALKAPRLDDTKDEEASVQQTLDFVRKYEFVELFEYFFTWICPLAERVAMSLNPKFDNDYHVGEQDYAVANKVGSVVKHYVEGVIQSTEVLLECLPEVAYVKMLET